MSFNGSGTFQINSAGQPVVSGTVISSTAFNALTADLATGLSTCITKDGQTTVTANIPMGNNKITGLAVGTAATDAANLSQVQSTAAKLINSISGADTVTGVLSPTLGAYAAGQMFYWVAAGDNTGAVTLNIDSLGAKAVTRDGSVALAAGDIKSGEVVVVVYDGTRFQVVSQLNSSGDARFANVSIASTLYVGGVATFTSGTAAAPAITTAGDTNTGIFFPAADTIAFAEGGTEAMRIDSSGNVGLGVTPSAWFANSRAIQMGSGACVGGRSNDATISEMGANQFINTSGTRTYISAAVASLYEQNAGQHRFYTAPSGIAGGTISFTQAMTLNANGSLALNSTSNNTCIIGQRSGSSHWFVGDVNAALGSGAGLINFTYGADPILFYTNATERARITSGGNFLINNTSATDSKLIVTGSGTSSAAYTCIFADSSGATLIFARNDGLINTGTRATSPYNNTTASAANMYVDSAGDLYRSTSSLKYKTDVQDATHGLSEVMQLRSVTYKGKNDGDTVFGGLIAEEVHAVGLTEFVQYAADGSPDALAYGNMVSLLVKAIQEQQAMINELKAKVAALETK